MTVTVESWRAWRRPRGGEWAVVAEAPTREAASQKLYALLRTTTDSGDSYVLPAGRTPTGGQK